MRWLGICSSFFILAGLGTSVHAECFDPKGVCALMTKCVEDTEPRRVDDRTRIKDGANSGQGTVVWQGLEACTKDMDLVSSFQIATKSCTDANFVDVAKKAIANQCDQIAGRDKYYCAVVGNDNRLRRLGYFPPEGDCAGERKVNAVCSCPGNLQGQVYLERAP